MRLFNEMGASKLAGHLRRNVRWIYVRRRKLEVEHNVTLMPPTAQPIKWPGCIDIEIKNGQVLIGSDFHIWPGETSTCLRAFKKFVDDIKPDAVILNGDVMDFPRISRHPQNWEKSPDVWQELEAASDHLNDIEQRCKRGAHKLWTLGNHDARFESVIANAIPQLKNVKGVHLADHFAIWQKAMSVRINDDIEAGRTMVKHRLKGGKHATYNNVRDAGTHIVTGHLHAQNVRRVSDYRRFDLYGVDTGCVAEKAHDAFAYTENAPVDWGCGFGLLTYRDGALMMPELIAKWGERSVQFRGGLVRV